MLHGGREHGLRKPSWVNGPAWRMLPFVRALARATAGARIVVAEGRYRHQGWNGERADAARDAAEAVAELSRRTGGAPLVIVGHSMGARAALRAAADPGVTGVVALAPWCPPGEPVDHLAGTRLVFAHGTADRITSPEESLRMAGRARAAGAEACRYVLPGGDHAMLRGAALWHALTVRAACGLLGLAPLAPAATTAFALPAGSPEGLALSATAGA
ncbi:alpha/beta fold hydrolase [Streptomyces sp.]|uniref:alpha/beta fold hydrolase n=1 Tax=Streptomyces sp. TaxID=1931 RepID=UPI002F41837A